MHPEKEIRNKFPRKRKKIALYFIFQNCYKYLQCQDQHTIPKLKEFTETKSHVSHACLNDMNQPDFQKIPKEKKSRKTQYDASYFLYKLSVQP